MIIDLNNIEKEIKINALSKFLDVDHEDAEASLDNYLVLTDEEADDECESRIKDSVWAFNASFLSHHTGLSESTLTLIQQSCEGCNEDMIELIKDFNHFVNDAVSYDGRGHFISGYDGNENEVTLGKDTFYIYRIN